MLFIVSDEIPKSENKNIWMKLVSRFQNSAQVDDRNLKRIEPQKLK